jgi:UDP-N-acetylglucosamine--N-acetylmuramyl-(pentapeptide) pyrophosphoryl-undecaprenol N-acetylglucosamine transferase
MSSRPTQTPPKPTLNRPILVMAGGTGGHVYPALAVARVLQRRSQGVVWLGTERGLEARVVPAAGISAEWISVQGLRGKGTLTLIAAPFQLLRALFQSLRVMARHRPAAVLGMGGFVSGPGGLAAWLTRRPLIIHEQNAIAGLTNRLLARLARVVLQAFPGSFSPRFDAETVGNPVREDIAGVAEPQVRFASRSGPLRLLVLGGSQGALALNQLVPQALAQLPRERRPLVRHQAGERSIATARENYTGLGVDAEVQPFIDDMAAAYGWADLVVCRAGALTVAELSAAGVPAIFVPFPAAVDDHQTANARSMVEAGAAVVVQERDLTAELLAGLLLEWLSSREDLRARAAKARSLAQPKALDRIAELCLELAGARP